MNMLDLSKELTALDQKLIVLLRVGHRSDEERDAIFQLRIDMVGCSNKINCNLLLEQLEQE